MLSYIQRVRQYTQQKRAQNSAISALSKEKVLPVSGRHLKKVEPMKKHILVASEDSEFRTSIVSLLSHCGHDARIATMPGHIDQRLTKMLGQLSAIIIDGDTMGLTPAQMDRAAGHCPVILMTSAVGALDAMPDISLESIAVSNLVEFAEVIRYVEAWSPQSAEAAA